ncbi:4-carboxymuconolactone decarboxylase [Pseudonocardia endophytica]|uniref:4-carboxymuconolactone decarboxylase n=1 Tax=Pseudonocardia endophytica TaxID=401976 RepID=A0A4V2PHE6_PSEEN|nr:4-carboxymuconolactone decarboxylase [Pseudonocardia endophytica]
MQAGSGFTVSGVPTGSRLPDLGRQNLDDAQRAVYSAITGGPRGGVPTGPGGSLHGPFNAMLHAPWVGAELQELGAALRTRGRLPARARELAVLAVAAHHRSGFEWWAHARIAADAGVPDALVDAARSGTGPLPDDPVERAALVATRELLDTGDLDDDAWAAAHDVLGDAGLVELTTLVGYYGLLALQMRVFRVSVPDGEADPWA